MSLLPQINNEINSSVKTEVTLPSKTYRLKTDATALQLKKGNKTTLKGTEINITDAKFTEENMASIKLKGSTTQSTRSGKNKFNYKKASDINNTIVSTYRLFEISNLEPNMQYTISGYNIDSTTTAYIYLWSGNTQATSAPRYYISSPDNYNKATSITFTSNAEGKIYLAMYDTTEAIWNEFIQKFKNAQIEKGTVATDYEEYGVMPSPDYPSEIENIEGKNIWNKSEISEKTSTVNIVVGELNVKDVPIPFTFSSYLISNALTNTNVRVAFVDSNNSDIGAIKCGNTITSTNKRSSITINEVPEGTVKIKFGIRMQDGGHTEKTQLEAGTVATPYVPYNSLEFKVEGKNILPFPYATESKTVNGVTFTINDDGSVLANGTATADSGFNFYYNTTSKIILKSGKYVLSGIEDGSSTTYYLQLYINGINAGLNITTPRVVSTKDGDILTRIVLFFRSGVIFNNLIIKPQFEYGSTATDYEPYKSQVVIFPLAEGQKLMEGSYLAEDGVHNVRKQVVLDGTEVWRTIENQTGTNTSYFYFTNTDMKNSSLVICDKFKEGKTWNTDIEAIQSINDNYLRLRINTSRASTIAELQTWLSINKPLVEYELAEPEVVPYTEEQQEAWEQLQNFYLFDGVNNISSDGSKLKPELELSYYDGNNIGLIKTEEDRIVGFVDNLEAIKQSIYHILSIERYAYLIYDDNYGVEFEQYIGKDFDYINATIENTLQEALLYDLRILNVSVDNIKQIDTNIVAIKFTVDTIYGDLIMEVSIDV